MFNSNLKPRDTGAPYCAVGELDDCDAGVTAFSSGAILVGFGLVNISLSRPAAAELVKHLVAALETVGGAQ